MKSIRSILPARPCWAAAAFFALLTATHAAAQTAPAATSPADLAKYDLNRNGVLDPSEQAAKTAEERRASGAAAPASSSSSSGDEIIALSPFEVLSGNETGYYASNTMSGTRMNAKLEDLGASITVVTKQQMLDTAALDLNDIFLYEANTEGTGQFAEFETESQGRVLDQAQASPNTSNRIRGIGSANTAANGFATTSRIPLNTYNIDSVEISRGPNSNLFGLGNASGTVNINTARANLSRSTSQFGVRGDDWGGFRATVDLNRPILKDKLALRASAVYEAKGFTRKPAHDVQRRQFAAFTYRPFSATTIRGSYEMMSQSRRTPNSVTPRDMVSEWLNNGRPTWDPITATVHFQDGRPNLFVGANDALLPPGLGLDTTQYTRPSMYVDQGELVLWTPNRLSNSGNPNTFPNPARQERIIGTYSTLIRNRNALYPLFTAPSVSSKDIYNYDEINFAATNWNKDEAQIYSLEIDQKIFDRPDWGQKLYAQAGLYTEDTDSYNRNIIRETSFLYVDINERLLDGRPNPFFLRPYVTVWDGTNPERRPEYNDNVRAQLGYELDFTRRDSRWVSWLGLHRMNPYYERRFITNSTLRFREAVLDNHIWTNPANRANGSAAGRASYKYYLGDNQGYNVDYAPPMSGMEGTFNFRYRSNADTTPTNPADDVWVNEPALFGETPYVSRRDRTEIRTRGFAIQSFFLKNRVVATAGIRDDTQRNRNTVNTAPDPATGLYVPDNLNTWGVWNERSGKTKTHGIVLKPFRWLNLHYNASDSFRPANPAVNLFVEPLPNPSGKGKDYGFSFNLLDDRLIGRVNWYETDQKNARASGGASTAVGRLRELETTNARAFNLEDWLTTVVTSRPSMAGATQAQIEAEVYQIAQLPVGYWTRYEGFSVSDVNDIHSEGMEIEVNYNPTRNWTNKFTAAQQKTIDSNLSDSAQRWIDERMPVWTSIQDDQGNLWWPQGAQGFYEGQIATILRLARATLGLPRSQIKEWSFRYITNYTFSSGRLKGLRVGGNMRWDDKSSIGFFGKAPEADGVIRELDRNRPIYDPARTSWNFLASYDFRLFKDKVRTRVQLNCNDAFAKPGLRPVGVNPDGTPHSFRIIPPRQWILSATFDL